MRCSQCGAEIIEDAKFCSNCGAAINNENEKIPETESAKKLQEQPANEIVTAPTPETKDDGGIAKPMKVLLGMVGVFVLFFGFFSFIHGLFKSQPKQQPKQQVTQQQTQQKQQKQQQPTQQQAQQQQRQQEQPDLQFSNFHVDYLPNFDGQNNLYVRVSCVVQNISDKEIRLTTTNCFLRKPGANTFESDFSTSGFTKDLNANNTGIKRVGAELENLMELLPGDKAGALLIFKTNIQSSQATGWEVHIKYYPKGSGKDKRLKVYTIP